MVEEYLKNDLYLNSNFIASLVSESGVVARCKNKHSQAVFTDLGIAIGNATISLNCERGIEHRVMILPDFNKLRQTQKDLDYIVNMHRYFRALRALLSKNNEDLISTGINTPEASSDMDLLSFSSGTIEWLMVKVYSLCSYSLFDEFKNLVMIQIPIKIKNYNGTESTGDAIVELRSGLSKDRKMRDIFISVRLFGIKNPYTNMILGANLGGRTQFLSQHLASRIFSGWFDRRKVRHISNLVSKEMYSLSEDTNINSMFSEDIMMVGTDVKPGKNLNDMITESKQVAAKRITNIEDKNKVFRYAILHFSEYFKTAESKLHAHMGDKMSRIKLLSYNIAREWIFGNDVSEKVKTIVEFVKEPIELK